MQSDDQFIAASIGDTEWLQQSVYKGTVKYDKNGLSALHLAAMHGHLACMKLLVEKYGFNVDLTAEDGCTPLQAAANNENENCALDCVYYLLDKGANPSLGNNEGTTALHQAASQGHLTILKLLIDSGATVDCRDNNGHIPLDLAQLWGHERCGRILRAVMWHNDKEYIAKQMKQLLEIKYQLMKEKDNQKEKKRCKTKQRVQKQQKQNSTNNAALDATKPKSRIKTSTIQTDKTLVTSKDTKKKYSKSLSKTKQIWKPFYHGWPANYIPNLSDEYPRDPYTLMPKLKNKTKYFDGKHKCTTDYSEVLFPTDDQFPNFQLPDLPPDIIAKILADDPTQFERPLVFKCKNILDVQAKWKPSNLPKNEVCLHLSSDTSSVVFQNSLQPNTKVMMAQNRKNTCTNRHP